MKLSVISWDASFRESSHILDFFGAQEFPAEDFELIWIDYYNSTRLFREKISSYPNFRLLPLLNNKKKPWHLGECINAGVDESNGEILVIADGDIVVKKNFLSYVWDMHCQHENVAIYFKRYDEPPPSNDISTHISIDYLEKHAVLSNPTNYAGCLTLRRETFKRIRGFETHKAFAESGANGLDTYVRLRNAGASIIWSPTHKIFHPWHGGTGDSRQKYREALRLARLNYDWILPYAGLEQSWIIHCRSIYGDVQADQYLCDRYLSFMPHIKESFFQYIPDHFDNVHFVDYSHEINRLLSASIHCLENIPLSLHENPSITAELGQFSKKLRQVQTDLQRSGSMSIEENIHKNLAHLYTVNSKLERLQYNLDSKIRKKDNEIKKYRKKIDNMQEKLDNIQKILDNIQNSLIWKITSPVRRIYNKIFYNINS